MRVVDTLGPLRWFRHQSGLHVLHEGSLRYRRRTDGPKYCRSIGHHLSTRQETESGVGALWCNGARRSSWWIVDICNHCPAVRLEMAVLHAVNAISLDHDIRADTASPEVCLGSLCTEWLSSWSRQTDLSIRMVRSIGLVPTWELVPSFSSISFGSMST